jgi:hypothetical protein
MRIEAYASFLLAIVYGLMLLIRLVYGWRANHQGGKAVRRREPGWSPILMTFLMVLSHAVLLLAVLWQEALRAAAVPLPVGWRWAGGVLGLCMDALFVWVHQALGQN